MQAVKYLYKYIYKGPDRAQTKIENINHNSVNSNDVDEIQEYVNSRYVSAIEAVWHIFHNTMHSQDPPVIRLDTHLEEQNIVTFKDSDVIKDVVLKKKTKLTAWFLLNITEKSANQYIYNIMIFRSIIFGNLQKEYVRKEKKMLFLK